MLYHSYIRNSQSLQNTLKVDLRNNKSIILVIAPQNYHKRLDNNCFFTYLFRHSLDQYDEKWRVCIRFGINWFKIQKLVALFVTKFISYSGIWRVVLSAGITFPQASQICNNTEGLNYLYYIKCFPCPLKCSRQKVHGIFARIAYFPLDEFKYWFIFCAAIAIISSLYWHLMLFIATIVFLLMPIPISGFTNHFSWKNFCGFQGYRKTACFLSMLFCAWYLDRV